MIRTSVAASTVSIAQAAPPVAKAELNWIMPPGEVVPSSSSQSGRSTIESLGMLMRLARLRSAERCSRIVVSARRSWAPEPRSSLSLPARSAPITRMFSAFSASATGVGRSSPMSSSMSAAWMLPSS